MLPVVATVSLLDIPAFVHITLVDRHTFCVILKTRRCVCRWITIHARFTTGMSYLNVFATRKMFDLPALNHPVC